MAGLLQLCPLTLYTMTIIAMSFSANFFVMRGAATISAASVTCLMRLGYG